jgi:hypothetical protein
VSLLHLGGMLLFVLFKNFNMRIKIDDVTTGVRVIKGLVAGVMQPVS